MAHKISLGKLSLRTSISFFYLPGNKGTYYWEGQHTGIKGLSQYTWMLTYIPQMRYALREFGLHYYVMAYGDDYKAPLSIPHAQCSVDMSVFKQCVVSAVADTARLKFAENMKHFDSYGSEVYISFCKSASVRGVEMPQGLRKIQKCYRATNKFLPKLDDYISSAFSNAHAAAKAMPYTYPAYTMALFWGYLHLCSHEVWEASSNAELHCAMMVPPCVDGQPILILVNFHTRAENDHLPMFLDLVLQVMKLDQELGNLLSHALSFEVAEDCFEMLLRDPYTYIYTDSLSHNSCCSTENKF